MQQQHLMQMNQNMIGGYTSPAAVTTDLIQQVLILTQIPPPPFYPRVYGFFLLCLCRDLAFAVAFGFCFFSSLPLCSSEYQI
jgi:hypothetical protein